MKHNYGVDVAYKRAEAELEQQELAEKCDFGAPRSSLSKIERNTRKASVDLAKKLSEHLDLAPQLQQHQLFDNGSDNKYIREWLDNSSNTLKTPEDFFYYMLALEDDDMGLELKPLSDKVCLTFANKKLNKYLEEWSQMKQKYESGEISLKEYLMWQSKVRK